MKKRCQKKYEFWTCLSIGTGSAMQFWNFQSWWRMWKWFKRIQTCASACLRGDGQSLQTCSRASLSLKGFPACSAKQAEHAKEAKQDKQAGCYVLRCSAICCCCMLLCSCRLLVSAASSNCMTVFIVIWLHVLLQARQDSQASRAS